MSNTPNGESVYREYPKDIRIIEEIDATGQQYRVEIPMHDTKNSDLDLVWETPSLAELYVDVYFAVGGFREEKSGERGVPPAVAMGRNDTVIAYLITQPGMSVTWASRMFDLGEGSVRTYISRVRERAEEQRKKLQEKKREEHA